jgi:hypothetical protein
VVAAGVVPSWAGPAERGSPSSVEVSVKRERFRLDFVAGFTSPDVAVEYDAKLDE